MEELLTYFSKKEERYRIKIINRESSGNIIIILIPILILLFIVIFSCCLNIANGNDHNPDKYTLSIFIIFLLVIISTPFIIFFSNKEKYEYKSEFKYFLKKVNKNYTDNDIWYREEKINNFIKRSKDFTDIQKQFCLDLFRFYFKNSDTLAWKDFIENNEKYLSNDILNIFSRNDEEFSIIFKYFYNTTVKFNKKEELKKQKMYDELRPLQLNYQVLCNTI